MVRGFFVGAVAGALEEVQEVAFEVREEMDVATAGGSASGFYEFHAFMFQFFTGSIDGIHAQGDMAETGQLIIAGIAEVAGGGVNLEHAAGELNEESGGFVNGKNEFCAEDAEIPIF